MLCGSHIHQVAAQQPARQDQTTDGVIPELIPRTSGGATALEL